MDLVSALAAPRLCRLGGEDIWVRPASLEDLAMILGWLDDVLPGKPDRVMPPRLWDEASTEAMDSRPGRAVIVYAAMRHAGASMADAYRLVGQSDALEWGTFLAAFFSRRRTMEATAAGGVDFSELWYGPNFAAICEGYPGHTLADVGRLTRDQYALLAGDGLPEEDPRRLTATQVEAMRLEGLRLQAERARAEEEAAPVEGSE